jgi:phosphate/sulfate permease
MSKIRWSAASEMVTIWLATIPVTMGVSSLFYLAMMELPKIVASINTLLAAS